MLNNLKLHFKLYFLIAAIYYRYKFCSYHAKKYLIFAYVCVFLLQKILRKLVNAFNVISTGCVIFAFGYLLQTRFNVGEYQNTNRHTSIFQPHFTQISTFQIDIKQKKSSTMNSKIPLPKKITYA